MRGRYRGVALARAPRLVEAWSCGHACSSEPCVTWRSTCPSGGKLWNAQHLPLYSAAVCSPRTSYTCLASVWMGPSRFAAARRVRTHGSETRALTLSSVIVSIVAASACLRPSCIPRGGNRQRALNADAWWISEVGSDGHVRQSSAFCSEALSRRPVCDGCLQGRAGAPWRC